MTTLRESVFLTFDTETTWDDDGTQHCVELGAVWGRPLEPAHRWGRFGSLVNPGVGIRPEASAVHHLVTADVAESPSLAEVLQAFQRAHGSWGVLHGAPRALCAHNAPFDLGVLGNQFIEAIVVETSESTDLPVIDTLRFARKLWNSPGVGHSNQALRYRFGLVPLEGGEAHRAVADAWITHQLLRKALGTLEERRPGTLDSWSPAGLASWLAEPMILQGTIAFGKHRGAPWAEVPKDYLRWCLANMQDLDVDQRATMEALLKGTYPK